VLLNLGHGQNGLLTATLFGAGALELKHRPIVAGVLLGALSFKPHLGLMIPLALAIWGRWRSFAAATATVLAMAAASLVLFGADAWRGFFANAGLARTALEQGLVGFAKMQSLFAAVRLWGGPVPAAYAAQASFAVALAAGLVWLRRRNPASGAEGPALIVAAVAATPFLLDYDLVILAAPLAWMLREGRRTRFLAWEKTVLAAAFVLPLVARLSATDLRLPLAPPVLAALFVLVLRRGAETAGAETIPPG
jgi:Glycosyltransferase family 87